MMFKQKSVSFSLEGPRCVLISISSLYSEQVGDGLLNCWYSSPSAFPLSSAPIWGRKEKARLFYLVIQSEFI